MNISPLRGMRRVPLLLGASRHSAVAALRLVVDRPPKRFVVRLLSLAAGSSLIGVAVAMLVKAQLGLAPYDVLSSGIADHANISLGQAGWAVAAVLYAIAAVLGRRPSLWGIFFVVANGLAIDAASGLINTPDTVVERMVLVVGAVVVMAAATNLVVHSGTTGGPFEVLMLAGEDRGVNRTLIRYGLDATVLVLGVLLGGAYGPATFVYGALMGIVLHHTAQAFIDHQSGRRLRAEDKRLVADACDQLGSTPSAACDPGRLKAPALA